MSYSRCNICCLAEKVFSYLLWVRYKFNFWHASAPWSCRPYKKQVVDIANKIPTRIDAVIEVGCGLGDIIARVNSKVRYGFDIDREALNAAKFLYPKKVNFKTASLSDIAKIESYFSESKISNVSYNLLIMINWVHNISYDSLFDSISALNKGLKIEYLIIDGIKPNVKGYQFKHGIKQYSRLGVIESVTEAVDGVRFIYLIKLTPTS